MSETQKLGDAAIRLSKAAAALIMSWKRMECPRCDAEEDEPCEPGCEWEELVKANEAFIEEARTFQTRPAPTADVRELARRIYKMITSFDPYDLGDVLHTADIKTVDAIAAAITTHTAALTAEVDRVRRLYAEQVDYATQLGRDTTKKIDALSAEVERLQTIERMQTEAITEARLELVEAQGERDRLREDRDALLEREVKRLTRDMAERHCKALDAQEDAARLRAQVEALTGARDSLAAGWSEDDRRRYEVATRLRGALLLAKNLFVVGCVEGGCEETENAIDAALAGQPEGVGKCQHKRGTFWDCDEWQTSCGEEYYLDDGTPKGNGYKFCPFCGKTLEEADAPREAGEEE